MHSGVDRDVGYHDWTDRASLAASPAAARAWVASVNAAGGLAGCHPVKLVVGDDGDDPAKAKAIVKKMVEEDKVVAFVATTGC